MTFDVGIFHKNLWPYCNCGRVPEIQKGNCDGATIGIKKFPRAFSGNHIWSQSVYCRPRLYGLLLKTQALFHHSKHTLNLHKPLELHAEVFAAKLNYKFVSLLNTLGGFLFEAVCALREFLVYERGSMRACEHCTKHGFQGQSVFFSDILLLWHCALHEFRFFLDPYQKYNTIEIKNQISKGGVICH